MPKPSLLEEIRAFTVNKGPACSVRDLLDRQLDASDREALTVALADTAVPATAICRALSTRGFRFAPATIQRHRRGDCRCSR